MTLAELLLVVVCAASPQVAAPAPPPNGPPASTSALPALVAELERDNPELQAAKRTIDMKVARIAPAGALADPVLSASSMGGFTRPPFFPASTTPNAFRQVGISQEIPFPGKRGLRSAVA